MMATPTDLTDISIPAGFTFDSEDAYRDAVERFRRDVDSRYLRPLSEMIVEQCPTQRSTRTIAGVPVEEFVPRDADPDRVLINLHGGAFCSGAVHVSRIESAPLAHRGGFRIVSVDYRQGHEHTYPAATEDVVAVYRDPLAHYAPGQIGIYGGSAGGMLTAQVTAWLVRHGLPVPGALGIFGAGTGGAGDGDYFSAIGNGKTPPDQIISRLADGDVGYFSTAEPGDPCVDPTLAPVEFRTQFPPTLLITGTRAIDLSPALTTHRALCRAGVDAALHVFDGLGHCFYYTAATPEAQDAYETMVRFFRKNLSGGE